MIYRRIPVYFLAAVLPLTGSGCIVITGSGWSWRGPRVWTGESTTQIPIDTADLRAVEVRTHNGSITFEGESGGASEAYVVVKKKGGGHTWGAAEAALEAIDVFVDRVGGDKLRVGWKWKGIKHSGWSARVSFEIKAPGEIRLDGVTHNGAVKVKGVAGEVRVVTHNGGVTVESSDGSLWAETHNGAISAAYAGDDVTLLTHNGGVEADLNGCGAVAGTITTHNGGVDVFVGQATSAQLTCRTHNGGISCSVPLDDGHYHRRKLTGKIGAGEGDLEITTHNGRIRIRKAAG